MTTSRFSKINLAVDVGAAPTLPVSKTSGLLLSQSTISAVRLFPNCQCLFHSHGVIFPANVCVFSPHRHRSIPVVRKEITMNSIATIGSTTNPTPYKGGENEQTDPPRGTYGKGKTTGERAQTLSSRRSVPLLSTHTV